MGSITQSTVELLGPGPGCAGGQVWVSCFAAQSSAEPLQLLATAGITEMDLLEDGSDTDPASGGEDGVSLRLTGTSHGETMIPSRLSPPHHHFPNGAALCQPTLQGRIQASCNSDANINQKIKK